MEENLKSRTAKGIVWGALGSGGMQLLNLLFGLFLSRMLTPHDYGIVGSLAIFSTLAGIFSESGFVLAIVNKKEATRDDYNALFWFTVGMSLTLYAILWFCAPQIAQFYRQPEMLNLSRFLFIGFLFSATASAPAAYMFRNLLVKERTRAQLTALTLAGIIGVGCAIGGLSYWSIAIQTVSYVALNALLLWHISKWRPQFSFHPQALKGMLSFSLRQLVVSVFNVINTNIFAMLLGRFYGMRTTGFYTQGNKWTMMGYGTVSGTINSIGQPVLREANDSKERLQRVFRKLLRFTAFVSFPCMFGMAIISKELIVIAVTEKWLESAGVMQILCIGSAFLPIGVLCGNLFNSIHRPEIYMWNTIALGASQLTALALTYHLGLERMLIVYSAINAAWILIWQWFIWRMVGISYWDMIKDVAPYLLIAAGVMALTEYAIAGMQNLWLSLVSKMVMASGLYCLLMWRLKSAVFFEAVSYIKQRFSK